MEAMTMTTSCTHTAGVYDRLVCDKEALTMTNTTKCNVGANTTNGGCKGPAVDRGMCRKHAKQHDEINEWRCMANAMHATYKYICAGELKYNPEEMANFMENWIDTRILLFSMRGDR